MASFISSMYLRGRRQEKRDEEVGMSRPVADALWLAFPTVYPPDLWVRYRERCAQLTGCVRTVH